MKQYIVDAFTTELFKGNQAAICVMDKWISDELMQNIAIENNFSETAFTVKENGKYNLRWFTPGGEIDFCGHATLGTAYVLFNYYEKNIDKIIFNTKVGELIITKENELIEMDFPTYKYNKVDVTNQMEEAIGAKILEAYIDRDLLLVLENDNSVINLMPDQNKMKELEGLCTIVTAKSSDDKYDIVSRIFAPKLNVPEDPVTGSSHCMIVPYWSDKLNKNELMCFQASKRTGILHTKYNGERVKISGTATLYSIGELSIDIN